MKLSVNLKAVKVVGNSRDDLIRKISVGFGYTYTLNHSCLQKMGYNMGSRDEKLRLYNLHKIRGKTKQIKYAKSNAKTGAVKGRTRKSEVVRKSHWVGYYYDIDPILLKALGLKVRQNTRNFTFSKK